MGGVTDLDMMIACARAMGLVHNFDGDEFFVYGRNSQRITYDPLHDDAQAMALVKRFKLNIGQLSIGMCKVFTPDMKHEADDGDLNYAIVGCVAKMQAAKQETPSVSEHGEVISK